MEQLAKVPNTRTSFSWFQSHKFFKKNGFGPPDAQCKHFRLKKSDIANMEIDMMIILVWATRKKRYPPSHVTEVFNQSYGF